MFKLIFYSFLHSPFSVSHSSLPLHLFFLPPQTHRPFFLPQRPIVDLHKPSRHKPVAADPRLAADLTHFSLSSLFSAFQFCVSAVLVFWLCVSGCACVSGLLVFRAGFLFRAWVSVFVSRWVCVSGCDFSTFFFFSSSLVLMGTTGLWLCSDFYGFDGGCGYVLVVEWNIILL